MRYGLLGGRHHGVVGRDDDDGDIGNLRTAGTHGRERLMSRSVEECNPSSVLKFDVVCADMLCDASGLSGDDVGVAYVVEQRGLTMVYVSHDSDYRRAWNEI